MNILVTAATSAEAYQLKNQLTDDQVILGDYFDLPEIMIRSGKMIKLPNPASNAYSHQLLTLCLDDNIEAVYALRDEEKQPLQEAIQLFEEYSIKIIIP
jgi:hypothetical protein